MGKRIEWVKTTNATLEQVGANYRVPDQAMDVNVG